MSGGALREVFAFELLPEHRDAFEAVLDNFVTVAREEGRHYHTRARREGSEIVPLLAACIADLRFAAGVLRDFRKLTEEQSLDFAEQRFCALAFETAPAVEELAARLERATQGEEKVIAGRVG